MKIICFGDSNTWGYDPRGYFGGRYDHPWPGMLAEKLCCTVMNWGENGREIPAGTVDFPAEADLVIIMLGTNDLLQGASPEAVCDRMKRFLTALNREKVLLIAPPPMVLGEWVSDQNLVDYSSSIAKLYKTLSERLGARFADSGQWNVPIAFDGVHLTEKGHRVFGENLYKELISGENNHFSCEENECGHG